MRLFTQGDWNIKLGNGYHLIQEVETRFTTTFSVIERFLKATERVEGFIDQNGSEAARSSFEGLLAERTTEGELIGFPALEAVIDVMYMVVEAQTRLQASKQPTMHFALPFLQRCFDECRHIGEGGYVFRSENRPATPP